MPSLPVYNAQQNVQPQQTAPLRHPDPLRNEAAQAGADDQKVLNTLGQVAQKLSDANDVMQYTEAKAKHGVAVADIEARAAADPNFKDSDKYHKELEKVNVTALEGIQNQQVSARAGIEFKYDTDIAGIKIGANMLAKQRVANFDNVQTSLNTLYQKRVGVSPNEQAMIDHQIMDLVHNNLEAGTMSEHEATAAIKNGQISGAMEGIFTDPDKTIADLTDKEGPYRTLPGSARMTLISRAKDFKRRQEKEATELQKEATFNNESNIVLGIAQNGALPTAAEMANMVRAGSVDADFAESALKAITSPDPIDARTDGEEFSKLTMEIMKSSDKVQLKETVRKILKGGGDGRISKPDMQILVQSAIAQGKQKRDDVVKSVESLGQWSDESGLPRADVFREYQKNIAEGKPIAEASDAAKKKVIVDTIVGAANLTDVPNVIVGKDSKTRYIFNQSTNVSAHRIYQPEKKAAK